MLKSKKSVTFDQNEAKMFAAGVKRFMEAKELSVQELASRIKETPEYVENILEGNVAVGLEDVMDLSLALEVPINLLVYEYRYQNGEDASVDIYNEMGNENEIKTFTAVDSAITPVVPASGVILPPLAVEIWRSRV